MADLFLLLSSSNLPSPIAFRRLGYSRCDLVLAMKRFERLMNQSIIDAVCNANLQRVYIAKLRIAHRNYKFLLANL